MPVRRIPILHLLGLAVAVVGLLLLVDALAIRYLPGTHLNWRTPGIGRLVLFSLFPLVAWYARSLDPSGLLAATVVVITAGGISNLACFPLFGGAPDYVVFARSLFAFGNAADWQAGKHFFNVGDMTITLGLVGLLAAAVRAQCRAAVLAV
jgi:lipoprotein signal peptidase